MNRVLVRCTRPHVLMRFQTTVLAAFDRVVPSFTEFYLILLSFTEFYLVLSSFIEFYRVLPSFIEFYWVSPSFTEFYRVLSSFTEFFIVLPSFTEFYRGWYWSLGVPLRFDREIWRSGATVPCLLKIFFYYWVLRIEFVYRVFVLYRVFRGCEMSHPSDWDAVAAVLIAFPMKIRCVCWSVDYSRSVELYSYPIFSNKLLVMEHGNLVWPGYIGVKLDVAYLYWVLPSF